MASHLYKLEKEWVPKLILEVPLVLFSPKWFQYLVMTQDYFLISSI